MKKNQKPADAIRPPENPKITYHSGYVDSSIQVFFICTVNDLALEHTKMLEWCKGQLGHYRIDWRATSVITVDEPDFTVLSLHPKGSVHVSCPAGYLEEAIDSTREGPARRGEMRELRNIAGKAYAVGMGRQVYRRAAPAKWERLDEGAVTALGSKDVSSFDSIHGLAADNLVAVGMDGAIWKFDGASWSQQKSPTTKWLRRVKCIAPDQFFACGQGGALVRGKKGKCELIEQGQTTANLLGLEWFNDQLYVTTADELYTLEKSKLVPVDTGMGRMSFGFLHANDGVMWSFGPGHLAFTDGKVWKLVTTA